MEHIISERAGRLTIDKIGDNLTLKLWYDTNIQSGEPSQRIPLFPEELDKLCEWWQSHK